MVARIDIAGKEFGTLTVISYAGKGRWLCRCKCGVEKAMQRGEILRAHSCGCLTGKIISEKLTRHGKVDSTEYRSWRAMCKRCHCPTDQAYARYGGRGISVCERWRDSFEAFLEDMGSRPLGKHGIDRVNNGGNYEPGNCRWATRTEQMRNMRGNRLIAHNGLTLCIAEWAEKAGLTHKALSLRLRAGKTMEEALATPLQTHKQPRRGQ